MSSCRRSRLLLFAVGRGSYIQGRPTPQGIPAAVPVDWDRDTPTRKGAAPRPSGFPGCVAVHGRTLNRRGDEGASTASDFNAQIIDELRANAGRVGGMFEGTPLLLLHTTGARTGRERVNPLSYLRDGERLVIFAANGGARTNPDWYYNLVANPEATVEVGSETKTAVATVLSGDERDRLFAEEARGPRRWEYQERTSRIIPVIAIAPRG